MDVCAHVPMSAVLKTSFSLEPPFLKLLYFQVLLSFILRTHKFIGANGQFIIFKAFLNLLSSLFPNIYEFYVLRMVV